MDARAGRTAVAQHSCAIRHGPRCLESRSGAGRAVREGKEEALAIVSHPRTERRRLANSDGAHDGARNVRGGGCGDGHGRAGAGPDARTGLGTWGRCRGLIAWRISDLGRRRWLVPAMRMQIVRMLRRRRNRGLGHPVTVGHTAAKRAAQRRRTGGEYERDKQPTPRTSVPRERRQETRHDRRRDQRRKGFEKRGDVSSVLSVSDSKNAMRSAFCPAVRVKPFTKPFLKGLNAPSPAYGPLLMSWPPRA
jgi:hypothetical protein